MIRKFCQFFWDVQSKITNIKSSKMFAWKKVTVTFHSFMVHLLTKLKSENSYY